MIMPKLWIAAVTMSLFVVSGWIGHQLMKKSSKVVCKRVIVDMLMQMRLKLFPILIQVAQLVHKQQSIKSIKSVDDRKRVILDNNENLKSRVSLIMQQIHSKITEEQLEHAIEVQFKDDMEIQLYKNQFQTQFEKCLFGIPPTIQIKQPTVFSQSQLLIVIKELFEQKIARIINLRQSGFSIEEACRDKTYDHKLSLKIEEIRHTKWEHKNIPQHYYSIYVSESLVLGKIQYINRSIQKNNKFTVIRFICECFIIQRMRQSGMVVSIEDLHGFIKQYQQQLKQYSPNFQDQSLEDIPSLLAMCNQKLRAQAEHYQYIIQQTITMLNSLMIHEEELHRCVEVLKEELQQRKIKGQEQKETINDQHIRIEQLEITCEHYRSQFNILHNKYLTQQNAQLQLQNTLSQGSMHVEQLQKSIKKLRQKIKNAQSYIQDLQIHKLLKVVDKQETEQTLFSIRNTLQGREKQLIKADNELKWEEETNDKHQEILKEKNNIINKLQQELADLSRAVNPIENYPEHFYGEYTMERKQSTIQNEFTKVKLSEELQSKINDLHIMDYRHKFAQSYEQNGKNSVIQNIDEDESNHQYKLKQRKNKPIPIDIYFAHYILISQSVKIKYGNEKMMNVDVKPYYSKILEQRTPMHMWDQWIQQQLKKIANSKQ